MNYLSAENLGKNLGERWILRDLTFGILQGEKVALIGKNGSGKTTLLNILAGAAPQDEGIVSVRKEIKTGYLSQNPDHKAGDSVIEVLFKSDNETVHAIKAYEKAVEAQNADDIAKYAERLTLLDGWDYEAKVKQILGKLGIHDFDKLMGELSGGQRKRVFLAKTLIEEPDFLIMDEPTNHLDIAAIEWLEGYLSASNMTLLMVTHDRYFLDKVCNRILELDHTKIFKYDGGYAYFLEKKAEREEIEAVTHAKDKLLLKKELEWMRRQPKARTTKAQYRIDAFEDLKEKTSGYKKEDQLELSIKTERIGNKILEINHVSKGYDDKILISEFRYTFKKGDRIGIVGPNGVGKSTLLGLITAEVKPDIGKIVKGETIKMGYYHQDGLAFDPDQKVIDSVREIAEYIKMADGRELSASALLTLFLFPPAVQYSPIEKLSGGEKRRLQLLKILVENPNFLILDEPTNDLDINTLNILEEFLGGFSGVLLVVSHDRYFLDRMTEHTFVFEGNGKIKDYPGNYTHYNNGLEDRQKEGRKVERSKKEEVKPTKKEQVKTKLTYQEQKEFEALEEQLPKLEKLKEELTEKLSGGPEDFEEIAKISNQLEKTIEEIEEKEMRWLELSEYI